MGRLHAAAVASGACAALVVASLAAFQTQQPPPVFRGGTELVHLDVSVVDRSRQPVRELTKDDFTLFEDGKPQTLEAFAAVDLPDVPLPATKWMREVTPDVTTNEIAYQRLVIIVLGEGATADLWAVRALKESAAKIINRLRPDDLATVLYSNNNTDAQNFTNDRAKLLKAVEAFRNIGRASNPCGMGAPDLLARVAEGIDEARLPPRRKTVILLAPGIAEAGTCPDRLCGTDPCARMLDVFRSAQRANINFYAINVMGLGRGGGGMLTLAENTGGKAIVNTNDFDPGIAQIFVENSSYYLLGYRPTNVKADGTFRRIEVKVNRPGVEVWTRKQYIAPLPPKPVTAASAKPDPSVEAIANILPKSDVPLRIAIAPFARPGESMAAVAVALGVRRPALAERVTEEATLTIRAFTVEGDPRGTADQPIVLNLTPARRGAEFSRYDLLARIDLKPGRYELRVSAKSSSLDKLGSVYADVDVPDFQKAPLSMSGVLLSVTPGVPVAPAEALSAIAPMAPTTERTFLRVERVAAFLHVYQGGRPAPVTLTRRILDANDATAVEETTTLAVEQFTAARSADVTFPLPVARLAPGEYLLRFEAAMGSHHVRRDVRFTVK